MKLLISQEELDSAKSRQNIPLECENCHNTFYRTKNIIQRGIKGTKGLYCCSKICGYELIKNRHIINLKCKKCNNSFQTNDENRMFCSRICSSQYNSTRWSEEAKQKIRTGFKTYINNLPEHVKKTNDLTRIYLRTCLLCQKEFYWKTQKRKLCSNKCIKKFHSDKCKNTIGMCKNNNKHAGYYDSKNNGKIWLESKWEILMAEILDNLNIKWDRNKNKFLWIDKELKEHHYYPDFYLPDYDIYLEPKNPWIQMRDQYKLDYVMQKYKIKLFIFNNKKEINENNIISIINNIRGATRK